ncbi:MAG: ATP-binding protein, partial [Planctomycetes bacterium]|nr:ATP-binding protein [Planctomycetota bacterium]
IDLGTNGEIVVGSRDFLACCSASAGPAFEGEASASGTRAMPGAIESVWWDDGLCWETIEDKPAVGICGTGYIDLLAELVEHGVVDRTGRFRENASSCLRKRNDGTQECVLIGEEMAMKDEDIVLTQGDIDNLVRAKGAIYAAASVLLDNLGMQWDQLDTIMLAGAFGEKMDKENAVRIGLLPDVPREKIEFMGNTSLQGTIMSAVDEDCFAESQTVARKMTYFELSTHPDYMDQFVAARFLPHTDPERFPTVCEQEPTG